MPDISLNAVANLGYAEGRFYKPVFAGTSLRAVSEIIGLKENSNGKTGIVYVHTTGLDDMGEPVLSYVRWVMVKKRNENSPAPEANVPDLAEFVPPEALIVPAGLDFSNFNKTLSGEPYGFNDYEVGEIIAQP